MCACVHCNYLTPISHLLWFDSRKPEFYFTYIPLWNPGVCHMILRPLVGGVGFVGGCGEWGVGGGMDDTLTIAIAK